MTKKRQRSNKAKRKETTSSHKPRSRRSRKKPFRSPPEIDVRICLDHDVVHAVPAGRQHVAHIVYTLTQKNGTRRLRSMDYFVDPRMGMNLDHTVYSVDPVLESKAGIDITIPKQFSGAADAIRGLIGAHVRDHLGDRYDPRREYKPLTQPNLEKVPVVPPIPPHVAGTARLELASKPFFKAKCRHRYQTDLLNGCFSAIAPSGYATPESGCHYCMDNRHCKYGGGEILVFDPVTASRQLRRLQFGTSADDNLKRVLVVGEDTDPGPRICRPQLLSLLDWAPGENITPLIRSKMLDHDIDVTRGVERAGGVIVVSLCNDDFEPGVVAHGFTQAVRMDILEAYNAGGVHGVAGVVGDPAQPFGGPFAEQTLREAVSRFPRLILYAMRAKSKALAQQFFGADFESRKAPDGSPMYERHGSEYVAAHVHPTIRKLIGRRNNGAVRLCMKSSAGTYCGACHMAGRKGIVVGGSSVIAGPRKSRKVVPACGGILTPAKLRRLGR